MAGQTHRNSVETGCQNARPTHLLAGGSPSGSPSLQPHPLPVSSPCCPQWFPFGGGLGVVETVGVRAKARAGLLGSWEWRQSWHLVFRVLCDGKKEGFDSEETSCPVWVRMQLLPTTLAQTRYLRTHYVRLALGVREVGGWSSFTSTPAWARSCIVPFQ